MTWTHPDSGSRRGPPDRSLDARAFWLQVDRSGDGSPSPALDRIRVAHARILLSHETPGVWPLGPGEPARSSCRFRVTPDLRLWSDAPPGAGRASPQADGSDSPLIDILLAPPRIRERLGERSRPRDELLDGVGRLGEEFESCLALNACEFDLERVFTRVESDLRRRRIRGRLAFCVFILLVMVFTIFGGDPV